jgi:hypothetical protein
MPSVYEYRIDELGWYTFEQLCQTLLKSRFGLALECWGGHGDWGRDAYSEKQLLKQSEWQVAPDAPCVFQVKFVEGANAAGASPDAALISSVSKEARRINERRLVGQWANIRQYVLVTNVEFKPDLRSTIGNVIRPSLDDSCMLSLQGMADLNALLLASPAIRTSFPQLLGIQDLSSLIGDAINKAVNERSATALHIAKDISPVFVPTEAYRRTISILIKHHFAVLKGPPEVGKTAIARMLSLERAAVGWQSIEVQRSDEMLKLYNPDVHQVFTADDAFGSTEFDPVRTDEWSRDLPFILRRLDQRHLMLWTSRTKPLHDALDRMHLQGDSEAFPKPGDITVDTGILTREEKAMILYRHAKAAGLSDTAKRIVKSEAMELFDNPHFTPERIRRLIRNLKAQESHGTRMLPTREQLLDEVRRPTESMRKSFEALSRTERSFLYAMLDCGSGQVDKNQLLSATRKYTHDSREDPSEILVRLSEHFLRVDRPRGKQ